MLFSKYLNANPLQIKWLWDTVLFSLFVSDEGAGHVSVKMAFSVFTHVHNWTSHTSYFLGSFKIKNHSVSNLHPHTDLCRVVWKSLHMCENSLRWQLSQKISCATPMHVASVVVTVLTCWAQISSTRAVYAAQQDNLIFGKCPVRIFYYSAAARMLIFHGGFVPLNTRTWKKIR